MSTVTVTFERWARGWELTVEGEDEVSTQSSTLSGARQQVRDYLDTIDPDTDHSTWDVTLVPSDAELSRSLTEARKATEDAAAAQKRAAQESRAVVARLARDGYKGADIAAILGVTRARASQLLEDSTTS